MRVVPAWLRDHVVASGARSGQTMGKRYLPFAPVSGFLAHQGGKVLVCIITPAATVDGITYRHGDVVVVDSLDLADRVRTLATSNKLPPVMVGDDIPGMEALGRLPDRPYTGTLHVSDRCEAVIERPDDWPLALVQRAAPSFRW
ncbi:MAG: hypothetical protein JNM50_04025 [Chromatiales bacterium]|nr:hypothetical protein [Chromatiales bacterium]